MINFPTGVFGGGVPAASVFEGGCLRISFGSALFFEKIIVIPVRIERPVQVDEINRFVLYVLAKDFAVVFRGLLHRSNNRADFAVGVVFAEEFFYG